jgi:hypothetical protein
MSLLADALQPLMARELISLGGRSTGGTLADVIIAPRASFDLDFDNTARSVSLDFRYPEPIVSALASDLSRFSCASFQTALSIERDINEKDTAAWGLVKLYYSAFYAGHALIRLFGEACSFMGRSQTKQILDVAAAIGKTPAFSIERGLYRCIVNQTSTAMECTKIGGASGGAHEAFWNVFIHRIQSLSSDILSGSMIKVDAQSVFAQLHGFTALANPNGNFSWLSDMRNELQYRQGFGVWFPPAMSAKERQSLGRSAAQWLRDPMSFTLIRGRLGPIGDFCLCCAFIIALCRFMMIRLNDRSTSAMKSFVYFGPIAFLNYAHNYGGEANG